jgi:hypothetical protein
MLPVRPFLMEPKKYDPNKHNVAGWFISDNQPGLHCFWDGGVSRGLKLKDLPWLPPNRFANTHVMSTGLWTDSLDPVPVNDAWLNMLPCLPLDGVLYKDEFLYFAVTAIPALSDVFKTGPVYSSTSIVEFSSKKILSWIKRRQVEYIPHFMWIEDNMTFEEELKLLDTLLQTYGSNSYLLKHVKLPIDNCIEFLKREIKESNYGLLLRNPKSHWSPFESDDFLMIRK